MKTVGVFCLTGLLLVGFAGGAGAAQKAQLPKTVRGKLRYVAFKAGQLLEKPLIGPVAVPVAVGLGTYAATRNGPLAMAAGMGTLLLQWRRAMRQYISVGTHIARTEGQDVNRDWAARGARHMSLYDDPRKSEAFKKIAANHPGMMDQAIKTYLSEFDHR